MAQEERQKNTWGGAGRGQGRPKGSKNKMPEVKKLAREFTEAAMLELARIAGLRMTEKKNPDGSLVLDKNGQPIMVKMPGSASDNARVSAITQILDRGWGKATQPISGIDDETGEPGGPVIINRVELEVVPVGTPMNDDHEPDDDEAEEDQKQSA